MITFKLVVTGSRAWTNRFWLGAYLDMTYANVLSAGKEMVVGVGDCPTGADMMTYEWCRGNGLRPRVYKADWDQYGGAAGPVRNRKMLKEIEPDLVMGFLQRGEANRGTLDCLDQAETLGIDYLEFWSDKFRVHDCPGCLCA